MDTSENKTPNKLAWKYRFSSNEVSGETFDDPRGRWKTGGGINVPVQLTIEMSRHKAVEIKGALRELSFHVELH